MAVDFVILCVTVAGIILKLKMRSNVRDLILNDGLVFDYIRFGQHLTHNILRILYFCCAFLANMVPVIIISLQLNRKQFSLLIFWHKTYSQFLVAIMDL